MALTTIPPVPARVHWDRHNARPATVDWGEERLRVLRLRSVRDERHAYRPERGPRLTVVVETRRGEAQLSWDARSHRWFLEALDPAA